MHLQQMQDAKTNQFLDEKGSFIYLFIDQTVTNLATRHSLVMLLMPKFITSHI